MTQLPTEADLSALTLRAICAYSSRCARHVAFVLKGAMEAEVIDEVIHIAEKVASGERIVPLDGVNAPLAASRVADASSRSRGTRALKLAALAIIHAADVAYSVVQGAMCERKQSHYLIRSARVADRIGLSIVAI